jgi:signal transduction histidine kinase
VSAQVEAVTLLTSTLNPPYHATALDVDGTLRRWGALVQGSRWVGCRLDAGRWCVAPVSTQPPAPPPGGHERRSRERITLDLVGLCLGQFEPPSPGTGRPRLPESDALVELARQPSVIAHEVANPLTAALVNLELCVERVREDASLEPGFRGALLEDLGNVEDGMDQAIAFLRSIQERARGALARSERFDAAQVVRSCVALDRPLARKRGVALEALVTVEGMFLRGDPNALYQILTNLIRNAVTASRGRRAPVIVSLRQSGDTLRLTVEDQGVGIAAEHVERIFEQGFTTPEFGPGSGTGLAVVRQLTGEVFGGRVEVASVRGRGSTFLVTLPLPPQRTPVMRG